MMPTPEEALRAAMPVKGGAAAAIREAVHAAWLADMRRREHELERALYAAPDIFTNLAMDPNSGRLVAMSDKDAPSRYAVERVSVPAVRSMAPHILDAMRYAIACESFPERAVEPWHPPEGMTPGDMAASFEVLTVDDLRGLPAGSVFVDLSRDAAGRPIGHSAYRVVSAGMVEACDGRKYDWYGSVSVFDEIDMGNAMRLVYRGAGAPSEAPEPIPAPVCFVEPGDVTASKAEPIATPARFGWSMYED